MRKPGFFVFAFSFSLFVSAQGIYREIDSLLDASTREYENFESQKSVDLAITALKKAEEIKSSQAIAEANYNIARGLSDLGQQKKSFEYIEKAEKESFARKNILFRAKLRETSALNYMTLSMYPRAISEYHKAISLAEKSNDDSLAKIIIGRSYGNLFVTYNDLGNLDSANYYLNKEIASLKTFEEKDVYSHLSLAYLDYGLNYLEEKHNLDSAQYFFQKSLDLLNKYDDSFKQDVYRAFGDLYYEKKDFQPSLDYYLKSRKIIEELNFYDPSYTYMYKRISNIYGKQQNEKLKQLYLDKYVQLKDSLSESKIDKVSSVVSDILEKEDMKRAQARKNTYIIVSSLFLLMLAGLLWMIKRYRKTRNTETKSLLENEQLLIKQENENKLLKQQLNDAFEEVVQLARQNHPCFWSRFSEVYPEFSKKLKEKYPRLQASELSFCAMLFLNFSAKDIAEYTFVTPKAVQNRKNRLRKKLNISSEEDLNIWMQNILD